MKKNQNKVELIGYAGKDAEVRELANGSKMARFTLGTHESYKNKEGEWVDNTTWHNIVMWNAQAEKAAEMVKKGSNVILTGMLSYRDFENKEGVKINMTEIVAGQIDLVV